MKTQLQMPEYKKFINFTDWKNHKELKILENLKFLNAHLSYLHT